MSVAAGVVTFLFTDVEGSTRRWETDAVGMRSALAAHDAVLRAAISAHGGVVFKHTGDGMCAVFASPLSAVDAAVEAQRSLELPVRMALATGEAERRDGDYFGAVLNRAARVMAAGHGGQILLADSTAGLLSGVDLVDLGPRRLRDLASPVGVFQVRASGLRAEFPPLRALDARPGNLRAAVTSFIGREAEVTSVQAAVQAHRLVTLTGVGGVGKTRLAVEVGARVGDEYVDGVWFFELAAVADPAAVPDAVAGVLGIARQAGKTVGESVAGAQEGRVRLLVFDNCEHVLDAAADLIDAILASSKTVRVLATSREGLGITDEQLWPVPALDVGAGVDSAAVALFVERAHSVSPRFELDDHGAAVAAVEICQRLDGIPLAIELAASRMASMTAAEVRDRLDQRFRLLVAPRRGVGRHHTLRHAVAWSYDLLTAGEKALFLRCAVFAGGFDLQSACAVGGFDDCDDYAVLDLLDALVRKSLIVADRSAGRTRYSMLETIRQFAEEQLVTRGDATEARSAHARHFAGRKTDIMALWDSPRQREAYAWFAGELANLRTAFRCGVDSGDLESASTIALYTMFLGSGLESYEPIAWAEELIEPARAVDHPALAALYVMASQCWMPGRVDQAVRYSDAGQMMIDSGPGDLPFGVDGWLGASYLVIGQPERWAAWCRARLGSGRDSHTLTRMCLVLALTAAGAVEEAMAAAKDLVGPAEVTHNPYVLSSALFAYGMAFRTADPDGALDALRRGLRVARDSGNRYNETQLAIGLSRLEAECGDPVAALDYTALAIRNYHAAGNTANMHIAQADLVVLLDRLERHEQAAIVAGSASSPMTAALPEFSIAISHLRDVLGDQIYESLAREGKTMSTTAVTALAYAEIEQARTKLEHFG